MKRTTIFLGDEQVENLVRMERRTGLSNSELIRRAIDLTILIEDKLSALGFAFDDAVLILSLLDAHATNRKLDELQQLVKQALVMLEAQQIKEQAG